MHSVFRQAVLEDVLQMTRIRLAVTENVLRDSSRVTRQMYEDFLEKDGRGWVAQVDGETVAFSYASRLDGSIWALFVAPRFEGLGLGRPLLALATGWLFSLGFTRVTLSTGIGTRAEKFYARLGWRRDMTRSDEAHFVLDAPSISQ